MIDKLSLAIHTIARHILTAPLIDKKLLLKYGNFSTNFRGSLL